MNYGDPWLIIKLHDCVFPFWHAILQPVLTITMNKMHWNETQLMNEQKLTWVGTNSAGPVIHQCERSIVIFHTITLDIMHSHPRCHIYAIISSVMITDWPCVATYQMHRNETQLMNEQKIDMCDRRAAVWIHTGSARSIAFRNSTGTWSRAPGILDRWRDRHTRPARWSDTLRIWPVRWRKWNRIRINLARLADPIWEIAKGFLHCHILDVDVSQTKISVSLRQFLEVKQHIYGFARTMFTAATHPCAGREADATISCDVAPGRLPKWFQPARNFQCLSLVSVTKN